MFYEMPESIVDLDKVHEIKADKEGNNIYITRVQGIRWYTNLDHGRRHEKIPLMSMEDNLKYSKHKEIK
jgi:hypothetical protein